MTMRFAIARSKPAPIYARDNIKYTHVAISNNDNKVTIPMQFTTNDWRIAWNHAHQHIGGRIRVQNDRTATAAQTRYLLSPTTATLHGKIQDFVLRLPPQLTTCLRHHFPSSSLPIVTTSLRHHSVIVNTLHQGKFHHFFIFYYILLYYILLYNLSSFIISNLRILFVRNTEILFPNFL